MAGLLLWLRLGGLLCFGDLCVGCFLFGLLDCVCMLIVLF